MSDQYSATLPQQLLDLLASDWNGPDFPVPARLSSDVNHKDYRPDCLRIGVIINGEERRDCKFYDVAAGHAKFTKWAPDVDGAFIQPFWRHPETRQQRRARERWEAKH
jgi:hypothetical protein